MFHRNPLRKRRTWNTVSIHLYRADNKYIVYNTLQTIYKYIYVMMSGSSVIVEFLTMKSVPTDFPGRNKNVIKSQESYSVIRIF